jgi:ribosomal protein L11 methyltransferase
VRSVFIPAAETTIDSLIADLWEMGTTGWIEENNGLRAFFDDSVDPSAICSKLKVPQSSQRHESPFDLNQIVPVECEPVLIGQRFYVAPSWIKEQPPEGRFRLTIDSTSAFGSGRHESTQLCIEILERHLRPGNCVLDIGCGSGILTAAASLLGAGDVFSCDIHQDSVRTAKTLIDTPIFVGSADGIRSGVADIVLANLSVRILDVVACDLRRIAKSGAWIVLGGFLHGIPPRKFTPREVWRKGDWESWLCQPEDIDDDEEPGDPAAHTQQWWL